MCFPLRFPSFPSAVSFPFSQWSEIVRFRCQGGYCRCNEAVFAHQSGWWRKVCTTGFLQDRTSRTLWMEKSHRAPVTFLLAELWLEIGSMKSDGEPSGLCPILSITATSSAELAVGRTGQVFGEQNWEGCWATFGFLPSSMSLLNIKPASLLCLDTTSRKDPMLFAKPWFAGNVWPRLWLAVLAHLAAKPALNQPSVPSQCQQTWVQGRAEGGGKWRSRTRPE